MIALVFTPCSLVPVSYMVRCWIMCCCDLLCCLPASNCCSSSDLLVWPFLTGCESNRQRTEQVKLNAQFISCRLCSIGQKVKLIPGNLLIFLSSLAHLSKIKNLILSCLVSLTMTASHSPVEMWTSHRSVIPALIKGHLVAWVSSFFVVCSVYCVNL